MFLLNYIMLQRYEVYFCQSEVIGLEWLDIVVLSTIIRLFIIEKVFFCQTIMLDISRSKLLIISDTSSTKPPNVS